MSESTIPFQGGGTALLERPAPELEPEPGSGSGKRTRLLALGGLAAVLVLGLVAYFLVFAGGDEAADQGPVIKPRSGAPVAPEEPVAEPVVKQRLSAKTFGRDPFKALITEPEAVVDTTSTTTDGTATATTDSSPTGTSPGTTAPETTIPTESASHTFKVVDVAANNSSITVKVDGDKYPNLKAGEVFATYFKVVLISGQVNSFQYGEEKFNVLGTKRLTIG